MAERSTTGELVLCRKQAFHYIRRTMATVPFSEKKLKRIARINEVVHLYFATHPDLQQVAATHLMPLFIRKGIFLNNPANGLPIRVLLRELCTTNRLNLLPAAAVVILQRSYFFVRIVQQ